MIGEHKTHRTCNNWKCESVLFICYYLLLVTCCGIYGQEKEKDPKKPSTLAELYNTSSCIPKPYRCPHPQIQYYLYTRRTQGKPELINTLKRESLYTTQFNRAHPTKVVVHGFGGGRNLSPSTDMRDAYFYRGHYNIFIVDYGTLVKEPCIKQMEWSPRFCALCVAHLVKYLGRHPRGVTADKVHVIGYSIGAHIAGLVANFLDSEQDGKLGRITGTLACDHTKVTPYFIESIITPRGFWAYPCQNLISFLLRICSPEDDDYVLMGEHVDRNARGIYYLTTNADPPFAQGHPNNIQKRNIDERINRVNKLLLD